MISLVLTLGYSLFLPSSRVLPIESSPFPFFSTPASLLCPLTCSFNSLLVFVSSTALHTLFALNYSISRPLPRFLSILFTFFLVSFLVSFLSRFLCISIALALYPFRRGGDKTGDAGAGAAQGFEFRGGFGRGKPAPAE